MVNIAIKNDAKSDDAEVKLQQLIDLSKVLKLNADDVNGNKAKEEYLREKYLLFTY